ncbi:MAG: hypothetical protein LBV21_03795 [Candidatus Adiutrix sp.]|jgi:hypothetical protein|nr:hypothetical protein [Candidatus Adiutrix sp.]
MTDEKLPVRDPAPEAGGDDEMTLGEPRLVSVRMFERDYQIMSDQPELVELLAAEINREARRLREISPAQMGPGRFDWPVQVAFRLALSRYRVQEAFNTLKAQVEADAEKMTERILASLDRSETP